MQPGLLFGMKSTSREYRLYRAASWSAVGGEKKLEIDGQAPVFQFVAYHVFFSMTYPTIHDQAAAELAVPNNTCSITSFAFHSRACFAHVPNVAPHGAHRRLISM